MGLRKNVASQKWRVFAFDRTNNTPKTGDAANITAKIRKDWGSATATDDTNPTEAEDGYYDFDLTQAETNANWLDLFPESSTSNIQVVGVPGGMATFPATGILAPTTADRTLTVEDDGMAHADLKEFKGSVPANLADTDKLPASVQHMGNDVLTAAAIDSDAITDAKVASDVTIASVTGAVGSVTGAVGSVTGNVGGNVVGSVGSVTGAVGSVTGNIGGNVVGSVGSVVGAVGSISGVTFPSNFASLGINASGHVSRVTLVDTTTTNTDMRGTDSAATASALSSLVTTVGVAGAGLTDLGGMSATMKGQVNAEADTALSDVGVTLARMGALTDWIDGGRLDLLLDAVKAKTDILPSTFPSNFAALGINASGHISRVTLTDTLTTYTNNTPQTGDAYLALTSAVPDSIPADGSRPSVQQGVYMLTQYHTERAVVGTDMTVYKPDGTTVLYVIALNDATTPTAHTRSS